MINEYGGPTYGRRHHTEWTWGEECSPTAAGLGQSIRKTVMVMGAEAAARHREETEQPDQQEAACRI